jgi:hypothetical protein
VRHVHCFGHDASHSLAATRRKDTTMQRKEPEPRDPRQQPKEHREKGKPAPKERQPGAPQPPRGKPDDDKEEGTRED